jgi:hypothetical protein
VDLDFAVDKTSIGGGLKYLERFSFTRREEKQVDDTRFFF